MLKLLKRTPITDPKPVAPGDRTDLQIRSLLDDPALRRTMGLAPLTADASSWEPPEPATRVPAPFNLRRLLRDAAA